MPSAAIGISSSACCRSDRRSADALVGRCPLRLVIGAAEPAWRHSALNAAGPFHTRAQVTPQWGLLFCAPTGNHLAAS